MYIKGKTNRYYLFDFLNYFILFLVGFVTLFPMWYILVVSISSDQYISKGLVTFWPRGFTLGAYELVFKHQGIWRAYLNTIIYTSVGTLFNMFFTSLCAYPLSRVDFYGRRFFNFFVILTMFVEGGMIPLYLVVWRLKLLNTIWAIVLPTAISTYNMIIMRTFFTCIPVSLTESAYLDGANDIHILSKIILPLSKPIMATLTLFYMVGHWNSFMPAVLYLNNKAKYPVQLILRDIIVLGDLDSQMSMDLTMNSALSAMNFKYAVIIITIIPILCVYPVLQKHFAKGAMIGAIKG
jgi:putative aldouronate transport system permease protein